MDRKVDTQKSREHLIKWELEKKLRCVFKIREILQSLKIKSNNLQVQIFLLRIE